jgi:hypothetical protein
MLRTQRIDERDVPAIAPGETKSYGLNWTDWLAENGSAITASAWASDDAEVTLSGETASGAATRVLVACAADAVVGSVMRVTNTVTAGDETAVRTLPILVADL